MLGEMMEQCQHLFFQVFFCPRIPLIALLKNPDEDRVLQRAARSKTA
jgi:hypothetical protein